MEYTPDTIREELSTIDSAVARARGITQQLLNFSRKSPQRLIRADVSNILDSVVEGLKEREFQVSNITVERDYDPNVPGIMVDVDQIRQVFLNLINNAGDAIKESGTIRLSARRDGSFIRVTISDDGAGMTWETMQRIFLPFYTTKEVGRGTGLGLSVSMSIVESMGGKIEVQSVPGAGSSFTVVLPIKEPEQIKNESA